MFHKEFYPTPLHVLQQMNIDCRGKIVLEPQAGKGDVVDFCYTNGAKEVLACEINKDLRLILDKKCQVIGDDFFNITAEQISHVDIIVMNPPFSNADKHIIHAFKIAPEGCEIISLCNYETISKDYRYTELSGYLKNYGLFENLGDCFTVAEKKTGVEVGLVTLYKPVLSKGADYNGFFMDEEEREVYGESGIVGYNEITALVQGYVGAMKSFDELMEVRERLTNNTSMIGLKEFSINLSYKDRITSKAEFSKYVQKVSWSHIFNKMNMRKYVTTKVMNDINKFVETQTNIPFTERNIYRMFEIIVGTRQETFNRALEDAVDTLTKYTSENRWGVEGWKTNSGYMLNQKFIIDYMCEPKWGSQDKLQLKISNNTQVVDDLIKVLCNITGKNYDSITRLREFFSRFDGLDRSKWYSVGFFEIKCFKKGTIHFKFQDKQDWYRLNKAYGGLKGFTLSEKYN